MKQTKEIKLINEALEILGFVQKKYFKEILQSGDLSHCFTIVDSFLDKKSFELDQELIEISNDEIMEAYLEQKQMYNF
ncbi:MAG: hypothetical protein ABIG69_13135 [Bacteroidota bacterium]